ncbi:class III extradiol dioxygenase subunit B-like domain-containing protein [Streptomyces sp. NPDC048560]|uniref:class III extradiol dioxygenase subunit B-like domain-containing protein n=1 Tax=Streptomyces sp. NPDC048560 TaxID=3155488 RepID=UPI003425BAC0
MLVAAAVCPCPPLLVSEVAAGAASEFDDARTACRDALGVIAAARPDLLIVVGPCAETDGEGPYPAGATGSFEGFGVGLSVRLGGDVSGDTAPAGRRLPASLAVGAWLLDRARWTGAAVEGLAVGERLAADSCALAGKELAARADRVALLVMGDGSACRTVKAPGYLDERAVAFDTAVTRALGDADLPALSSLDASLGYALKAAGRAPWQVLAGAAEGAGLAGRLLYADAPYGVGYTVAVWS